MKTTLIALALTTIAACASVSAPAGAQETTADERVREIAVEAYIYLYPLVTMDVTRRVLTNVPRGVKPGMGPMNEFSHMRTYPDAAFREVVRPNFDTLYSTSWIDLTREPVILSAPDTQGRYYLLPIYDMWTDAIAVPGKRTSGTGAGHWALVPPGWNGSLPVGVRRIDCPTPYVWIIGRTQTNGPKDYEAVHKVQDGYQLSLLSQWGNETRPAPQVIDPAADLKTPPLDQVNGMPGGKYFAYAAELLKIHRPHMSDWSTIERMRSIGLEVGKNFDFSRLAPAAQKAVEDAPAEGLKRMKAKMGSMARIVNGWQMNTDTMGVYGNYYLKRAIVAMTGLGSNQEADAIYPVNVADADGKPLDGSNKYVLHFAKEELPPAEAFWSLTMYDAEGFQAANPLNRFAIGDRDQLKYNADGSLDLFMQHESPGPDKESNWLPSPPGLLGITMRLYAPKPPALNGVWAPPAVKRLP